MELLKEITAREMLRRWAIGEAYVDFAADGDEGTLNERLTSLESDDLDVQKKATYSVLKQRHFSLMDCVPEDTIWYLCTLKTDKNTFGLLKNLFVPDLARITNNTYRIPYAAYITHAFPELNPRITAIAEAFRQGRDVSLSGISLLAKSTEGPFTIIEGNGRLTSLYQLLFNEKRTLSIPENLEVVLGISEYEI